MCQKCDENAAKLEKLIAAEQDLKDDVDQMSALSVALIGRLLRKFRNNPFEVIRILIDQVQVELGKTIAAKAAPGPAASAPPKGGWN
jgi:hypothetical protein